MSVTSLLPRFILAIGCLALLLLGPAVASAQVDTLDPWHVPEPVPTVPRVPVSPLADPFPYGNYRHSVTFDSLTGRVQVDESLFGSPFGQPHSMSLDDFIAQHEREQEERMWEQRSMQYQLSDAPRSTTSELDKILGNGIPIDIPIPQNPIFSIFGAPTISINVNGSVNVSAGWQWDNNNLTSINALGSTQSAPFFNQNIQVAVSGKVGDKLKLTADFDTQRTFDFDNQLKIGFGGGPGSDDDIIQSVEAGAVQLQSPSTLIGGSQTLFGLKTSFKFGPLFLTTIASQKRGERKTVNVTGGSVKTQVSIKPYDYAQNHFWLDTAYKSFYDIYYSSTPPAATQKMSPYKVTDIEVYEQVKDQSVAGQFKAIAYADLRTLEEKGSYNDLRTYPSNATSGTVYEGRFIKLDNGRGFDYDPQLGTITIKSLQQDKMYAVAYKTSGKGTYGEFSTTRSSDSKDSTVVLKLIYVSNLQPSFTTLWARQMKNIYPLQGVRNVNLNDSKIRITYGVPPDTSEVLKIGSSPRLVKVLGVDRVNASGQPGEDGEFDIRSTYFFDAARGEIIFPSTEPFRLQLRQTLGADAEPFILDAIYNSTREDARRDTKVSKYTISGDIAGSGGNKISLGAFNLAPNSIKVTSNGEPLVENLDYRVDPVFGEVTLLSPRANSATGNLSIEYEQNDFYTIAQKTLLGLRADYDLLNKRNLKSKIGMTVMRYGQTTPTTKVQIYSGDEPVTNLMVGFDGWVDYKADFLTKAIDALPFIDTKEPSSLRFQGEWAMVMPNPNTKASLVASDLGKGAAYIDDFESGAKREIQLGVNYTLWHPASPPIDSSIGFNDSSRVAKKGHLYWYNREPANTPTIDIWPNKDVAVGAQKTSVMDVIFNPNRRGIYNYNFGYERPEVVGTTFPDSVWGGMMRSLSFYTTNLDEENIDYIEITMQVQEYDPARSKMYIDLGQISEDVIPDQTLSTEDGHTGKPADDILNEGEDIGIDTLSDAQEIERYGSLAPGDNDPSRDDWSFSAFGSDNYQDYVNVNGMEGNVGQERGPFPDTEDLNGNKSLDLDNTYFRYEVNLDPNPLTNPQVVGVGGPLNSAGPKWVQYRIPIRTNYQTVGHPSFSNVQFARVVVKGPAQVRARIADFNLVGSDWRNLANPLDSISDPKLDVAFVNLEDNAAAPDFYSLPPGVSQEEEYSTAVLKNEQSLALRVKCLDRGETRAAVRIRPRSFDLFNYKEMKFFLHGGGDMDQGPIPGQGPKVVAFMRFGWDSLNYYEYRTPLYQGWNEYTVNFNDLASIKQSRGNFTGTGISSFPVPGRAVDTFAVRGIPSLTRVQFIAFGIENESYPGCLTTTMWVDELRAVGAEDANDWAATVSAAAKLADLGTINFNASRVNPNFHRLEERFGDRVERTNWAANTVFNLEKFLPTSFKGSSVPLTYNHVEEIAKPRYISESDVEVNAAAQRITDQPNVDPVLARRQADSLLNATQTLRTTDAFALSNLHIVFPGQNWLVRDFFNRFTFGYTYNQVRERSPILEQRFHWDWAFRGQYQVNIPQNFDLQPFKGTLDSVPVLSFWKDFRINFLPNTFTASTSVNRDRTTEKLRELLVASPVVRNFAASRSAAFNWRMTEGGILNVTTDYTVTGQSSLSNLETDALGRQRSSGEIVKDLFLNEGRLFNFGLDNDLQQTVTFNTRPRIPFIPNVDRFITPSARYTVQYHWTDQLTQTDNPSTYTKSAQWNSTSTLGMDVRLRQIGDALFGEGTGTKRNDSTAPSEGALKSLLRYLIKVPILDFETVRFQFTQNNAAKNPGVVGATGVTNLWGRTLLGRSESADFGPGAAYQLGLISDPHGKLDFGFKPSFPFISVSEEAGVRAPNIYVPDNYSQDNNLTASTDRSLWPGASLNLNWKVAWRYNQNYYVTTDANGLQIPTEPRDVRTTGSIERSYLSLPNIFFLNVFNNDIEGVVSEYTRQKGQIATPIPPANQADTAAMRAYNVANAAYSKQLNDILTRTFEKQLESLNWLPGEISRFLPRLNWTFQWNGLENLPFMKGWAQNVSLRHSYNGTFTRTFRVTDADGEIPETETVRRGFSPLIQINVTGRPDVFNGTATGSISYNTTTDFNLVAASSSEISKELNNQLQVQLSYQKRGMSIPLFGLNLKNDIEFATTFSLTRTNRIRYDLTNFSLDGNNDGSTRITFRPSVRYSLSTAVTASAFVSYDATIPDAAGSRDISRSTTQVGIDLRVGISGGR